MAGRFGTDGIRGPVGSVIDAELAMALGRAVGHRLGGVGRSVLLGRDTRRSGEMLSAALAAGLASTGTDAVDLGVVTTPCLVHASLDPRHAAGIMVSASHNPAPDNGLKVVVGGRKADDPIEAELDTLIDDGLPIGERPNDELGRFRADRDAPEAYARHLREVAGDAFTGLRLGIDCANGSASHIAPDLFRSLGAQVTVLFDAPNGTNINEGCGSTHPERLAETVSAAGLEVGFAFDGDADRLIAVDARGAVVDGDQVLGILALERLRRAALPGGGLVVSVLSNGGLQAAVEAAGGTVIRTPVGDKYILDGMQVSGAVLGGEKSGHVIVREHTTSGDGIVTALEVLRVMTAAGASLAELAADIPLLPQQQRAIKARHKDQWEGDPALQRAIAEAQSRLGTAGRVLVRPSGTEPALRVMVEGPDTALVTELADALAALADERLN
jgi:phosphoglucosamine mutase